MGLWRLSVYLSKNPVTTILSIYLEIFNGLGIILQRWAALGVWHAPIGLEKWLLFDVALKGELSWKRGLVSPKHHELL